MKTEHPLLSDDPVLDALDREEAAPVASEMAALLGKTYAWAIPPGDMIALAMPPAAVFGLLTVIDSPLLWPKSAGKTVDADDLRIAGWLIVKGREAAVYDRALAVEPAAAFWGDALPPREDIDEMIRDGFAPYLRMPQKSRTGDAGEPLRCDGPFLSGLVARVHAVTGLLPDRILWQLPMAAAALYDLEYCRWSLHMDIARNLPPSADLIQRRQARYRELLERKS